MAVLKSWKFGVGFTLTLCVVGFVYFGYYYCAGTSCALRRGNASSLFKSNYDAYFAGKFLQNKFAENELDKDYHIDLENEDVIVFLHIQKTGGSTFGKHLVENLEVKPPCHCYKRVKKHCDCFTKKKQVWLFSRFSTGWRCGLHADWTELTSCVDDWFQDNYGYKKRHYHYITMLRDPMARFISEWMHVRRGATWKTAALKCNGREATLEEVPFCFNSENWEGVTLKEFLDCKHNLAFNRQTRMLANLSTVHCYNTSALLPATRDALLLASAKDNLLHLAFFGLVEFQTYTQFLFEHTLNMNFLHDFVQNNRTHSSQESLSADNLKRIAELNHLDIELYQFAKDLFLQRVKNAYAEEGLPVSQHLEDLIAEQAVEQEGDALEGGYSESLTGVVKAGASDNDKNIDILQSTESGKFEDLHSAGLDQSDVRRDSRLIPSDSQNVQRRSTTMFSRENLRNRPSLTNRERLGSVSRQYPRLKKKRRHNRS